MEDAPMSGPGSNGSDSVEVVATVQDRRRWSVSEKIRMVEETERPGMSVSFVARQNGIAPNLLFRWRKLVKEGGLSALKADESVVGTSEVKQLKNRIRELERILGRKTLEAEILQEALEVAHEKNGLRGNRPFPKAISSEDGVPRPEDCQLESSPTTSMEWEKASGSRSKRRRHASSLVEGDCRTETNLRVPTDPVRPEPNTKDRGIASGQS